MRANRLADGPAARASRTEAAAEADKKMREAQRRADVAKAVQDAPSSVISAGVKESLKKGIKEIQRSIPGQGDREKDKRRVVVFSTDWTPEEREKKAGH